MAAPKENSLSLKRGIGMERNIFRKQREHSQNSISVLQHLEELKKRELAAKLHNRQLLQQFEEAQDTLRSMLTLTASMRTIRMEYERYLEYERFPLRQQQLWEKKQASQRKKNTGDEVVTAAADQILTSPYHNQERSSDLTYTPPRWLSCLHPQLRCPVSVPSQPYQFQQLASLTGQDDKARLRQNAPPQASLQSDHPWSCLAGNQSVPDAMWERLQVEDTFVEKEGLPDELSGESSSKTERCPSRSCSSHLSQELDDKPVRLSNILAESSSESSQVSSSRKKEKRASSRLSSTRKGSISQDSSKASSVTITAKPCKASQKSGNSISSEEGLSSNTTRRKKGGHATGIERNKKEPMDKNREQVEETKEEKGQSKGSKGKRSKEESGSQEEEKPKRSREKLKNVGRDLSSSSEEDAEEEQREPPREGAKDCDSGVKVNCREEVQEKLETEDILERQNSTDEEAMQQEEEVEEQESDEEEEVEEQESDEEEEMEEQESDEEEEMEEQESDEEDDHVEQSDRLSDGGKGSPSPTSLQGEKESEGPSDGGEGKDEERGELDQEEEEGEEQTGGESDQAEEESNSDDGIISPQRRSKELHSTQEDRVEHDIEDEDGDEDEEEGSTSRKSEESSDDDDIEQLLAPQEQLEEKLEEQEEQEEKETTKAFCKVQSFQVKAVDLAKTDDPCDSDQYDDFYD